jgi:hypothetical protein
MQIWDMAQSWDKPPTPTHTLHTPYPLRRIAWRPNHDTELVVVPQVQALVPSSTVSIDPSIASIPQGLDHSSHSPSDDDAHIEVWDVRRHYIAKHAVPTRDGPAVDIVWSGEGALVATFQAGGVRQIDLRDVQAGIDVKVPLDGVPRQVMAWNGRDELVYALDRFKSGEIPFDDL